MLLDLIVGMNYNTRKADLSAFCLPNGGIMTHNSYFMSTCRLPDIYTQSLRLNAFFAIVHLKYIVHYSINIV